MRKPNQTLDDIAATIDRFVDGKCEEYEWDDLMSHPLVDPELEAVRRECADIEVAHPPRHEKEWCNDEGGRALRRIAKRIRAKLRATLSATDAQGS